MERLTDDGSEPAGSQVSEIGLKIGGVIRHSLVHHPLLFVIGDQRDLLNGAEGEQLPLVYEQDIFVRVFIDHGTDLVDRISRDFRFRIDARDSGGHVFPTGNEDSSQQEQTDEAVAADLFSQPSAHPGFPCQGTDDEHQDQEHVQIVEVRTAADLHREDQASGEEDAAACIQQQLLPAVQVPSALACPDGEYCFPEILERIAYPG